MLPTKISSIVTLVVAIVAICLVSYPVEARAFVSVRNSHSIQSTAFVSVRGGATALEEEEELEIESSDYEDSDEEEEDPKLAKSAQTAVSKVAKKAISSTLASTKPAKKTKNSGLSKLFKIPYIVGACLNPIVLVKMIMGYWASLVNLEYLKENVVSSGLFLCVPFFCHLCFGWLEWPSSL